MKPDNKKNKSLEENALSYRAFLIRGWREGDRWRFMLESIGEERTRQGFSDWKTLVAYLQAAFAPEDENA